MANETNESTGQMAPLDPKTADRLLDLLGTDDDFRELFRKDPQTALAQVGHEREQRLSAADAESAMANKSPEGCFRVEALASKEAILQARDAIRSMLAGTLSQTIPHLDALLSNDRRTLR